MTAVTDRTFVCNQKVRMKDMLNQQIQHNRKCKQIPKRTTPRHSHISAFISVVQIMLELIRSSYHLESYYHMSFQHRKPLRHAGFILLHDFHQIHLHFHNVNFYHIIAVCKNFFFVINCRSFDVLHDQRMHGRIFLNL